MEKIDLLFWTDILSEHAMFQINAFSPKEERYIQEADKFLHTFRKWNQRAAQGESIDLHELKSDTAKFIAFKKAIIFELLSHNLLINFSPSFVNHMVNEAEEFLDMLHTGACPKKTQDPSLYIQTWLADASGHASTLAGFLDAAEMPSVQRASFFKMMFDRLEKKASELVMISGNLKSDVHTCLLKEEVFDLLEEFIQFNERLGDLLDMKKIMSVGTLSSVLTKHFIKEHEYFINKVKACT